MRLINRLACLVAGIVAGCIPNSEMSTVGTLHQKDGDPAELAKLGVQ